MASEETSKKLQTFSGKYREFCSPGPVKVFVKKRFPIASWLPEYNLRKLQCDMIAGLTVGLMVVPQGLAYAQLAGLPQQYGLYSAFMGCFLYCILGTSKDITLGPTAIMSLVVSAYGKPEIPHYVVALTLYTGIILLAMGFLRLGFVVNFISIPIVSGFTSAATIIIAFSQLKDLFGLQKIPRKFAQNVYFTFKNIGQTNKWDLTLGLICIIILITLRKVGRLEWVKRKDSSDSRWLKAAKKTVWLISISRNALIILIAAVVSSSLYQHGHKDIFTLPSRIKPGLPLMQVPALSFQVGNATRSTLEVFKDLGPGLAVVPLIGFLESIAIAKAFARKNRYTVDASQELIALGVANCLSSFVSSYPVTGSFSRTAVNAQSGVATPAGGIFTGAIVLLALGLLTDSFKYIPKASLAALIMSSVITMIEYHIVPNIWKVRRIDLVPLAITFFGCFYDIEVGILAGIAVAFCILLYNVVWPPITRIARGDYVLLKINGNLNYPGIEHLTNEIQEVPAMEPSPPGIVIDFSLVTSIDFTVTQALLTILEDMENKRIPIFFSGVQDIVRNMMMNSGIDSGIINQGTQAVIDSINSLEIVEQN
ncbi:sodium-independent sulfate anion transporter-like isoform X3 [Stylophora pistillata]|uniref:sodium-independent sulfate anion transporter-like isoform X3 n=1 Tax=Stylophora pistillata TaxID=50429 RepID=UPI000C04DAA3|nr:sodium-independent sulfate anion transporter-like isoform X3 [Stylophora pistillata]